MRDVVRTGDGVPRGPAHVPSASTILRRLVTFRRVFGAPPKARDRCSRWLRDRRHLLTLVLKPARGRATLIAAGALLAVLACSGGPPEVGSRPDGSGTDPGSRIEPVPEAPGAPNEAPTPTDPTDTASWSIGITSAPSTVTGGPLPVLTGLRAGTHPDYERVTLELAGGPDRGSAADVPDGRPGYKLEYVDRPLRACGSGDEIFPVGDAWLEIRLEPAAAHTEAGQPTLGPREVHVDGPLLQRIYRTCDFEGIVAHVLALASPNEYRVFTLEDPLRIVVDVRR